MSWEMTIIGDHCTVTSSKRFHLSERSNSGVPFYCSKEIIQKNRGEEITDCDYISEELYLNIAEKFGVPQENDLLVTTRGTIGVPYLYRRNDRFYFADGNLTWIKDFKETLLPQFLYYWFRTHEGQKKIDAIAKGTAQKAVPIAGIKTLEISLPPIDVQRQIADILTTYDSLIENNQKQIKLLEEATQRLYKEWFVDLRFPGHENVKIVDGVPEGWKKVFLGGICTLKKDAVPAERISTGTPYIGLEHMPRVDFCLSSWGSADDVISNKFRYAEDDIIFGKIRPYFHKVGFALNNGVVSTDSFVMKANDGIWGLLLMTVFDRAFVDYTYQTCKEGSKMPRADWNQMEKYPVLIPSEKIRQDFEKFIWNITRQVKTLALQNHALTEARDQLLPKLMSGEIEA